MLQNNSYIKLELSYPHPTILTILTIITKGTAFLKKIEKEIHQKIVTRTNKKRSSFFYRKVYFLNNTQ